MYANRLPEVYAEEVAAASAARVSSVRCPGDEFDRLVSEGERLVFVVTLERDLIVAPQVKNGFEIRHPVLARGHAVLAAGEVELVQGAGMKLVLELTNKSGHYVPEPSCLDLAVQLLEDLGFSVPSDAVLSYPGD